MNSKDFEESFFETLSDYITAIAWSPQGTTLATTSAAGEIVLWQNHTPNKLQDSTGQSVDCVAFSPDEQFLAVGGQDGRVKIWRDNELIATLENSPAWVDRLAWNPHQNQLAFSLGRYVQVWDADTQEILVTLNFDNSSVLSINWHSSGQYLAISGHRGVKVWNSQNWDNDPYILDVPSASLAIAWSPDGKYLAVGNMDRTISVVEAELLVSGSPDPQPWVMRGFPGKIRQLTWSQPTNQQGAPLLACCSVDGIVVWEKHPDDSVGWDAKVLTNHAGIVSAIAFAPKSFLLASVGSDGWLCLWKQAKTVSQILTGVSAGFSCLAWHPEGKQIAAGGENGELRIWCKGTRGQGFGC